MAAMELSGCSFHAWVWNLLYAYKYLRNKDQAQGDCSECYYSCGEYPSTDVDIRPQAKGDQCQNHQYDARNVDYGGNEFGVPQAWKLHFSRLKGQNDAHYLQHEQVGVDEYLIEVCWGRSLIANPHDILLFNSLFLCGEK